MSEWRKQPQFNAFNPHAEVRVYYRNLPHWRQAGATYFVTFRLGDSIPKQVLLRWREEDDLWFKAHEVERFSEPFSARKANGPEDRSTKRREEFTRRTARRMHVELDKCSGGCLFRDARVRDVLAGALAHFHGERWWLGDYVIMPNHVHGLFQPIPYDGADRNGAEHRSTELEDILASVKGFVSTRLTKLGFKQGIFWQQENYDRLVRDQEELTVWRKYIRQNPEKAKLDSGEFTWIECDWM